MKLKFIALSLAFTACAGAGSSTLQASAEQATASASAYAESSGESTYTSNYFDLKVTLPGSWVMASEAEAEKIINVGTEMVAGDDEAMKKQMDASVRQSLPIMFASRYPMSGGRGDNINISSIAENVAAFPFVKGGADYFDNMKLIASQSATPIDFEDGYTTKEIGGVTFTTMNASITLGDIVIKQEYYATRLGDHVVSLISTYLTDEDKFMLDGIISTIEID